MQKHPCDSASPREVCVCVEPHRDFCHLDRRLMARKRPERALVGRSGPAEPHLLTVFLLSTS